MKRARGDYSIRPNDTLTSLFGPSGDGDNCRNHGRLSGNDTYEAFQAKFKKIHEIGRRHNVSSGEVLLMISHTFHYALDTIPFSRLDEIATFVEQHIDTRYKIIDQELHNYLSQTNYYKRSSTAITPPQLMSGFLKELYRLIKNKAGTEACKQFGIEVMKKLDETGNGGL